MKLLLKCALGFAAGLVAVLAVGLWYEKHGPTPTERIARACADRYPGAAARERCRLELELEYGDRLERDRRRDLERSAGLY
jgi:hypothetical protein